jgi:hypothetical protein
MLLIIKEMALALPYTLLTQGLYSGVITGISTMTVGMCRIIRSIYSHKNPDVDKLIKKLDIEYHIILISTILKNFNKTGTIDIKEHIGDKSIIFTVFDESKSNRQDPIQISLTYLSLIIRDIHNDLMVINQQIEYHNTKWLSSWRTLNIKKYLDILEIHNTILVNRYNDFLKIYAAIHS